MCRSVVQSKNLPLLSGKRALYTIHPIEQLEMNEFNKRNFPKADVRQEQFAHIQNVQTFKTAMPKCEFQLLDIFVCVLCQWMQQEWE